MGPVASLRYQHEPLRVVVGPPPNKCRLSMVMATSAKRPLKHRHAHRRWDSKQASIWRRLPLCYTMVSTIFVKWGWCFALEAIGAHLVPLAIILTDAPPARSPAAVIAAPGAATGDPAIAPATVAGEAITGGEAATAFGGANTPAAASPTPQMKIHSGARGSPMCQGGTPSPPCQAGWRWVLS